MVHGYSMVILCNLFSNIVSHFDFTCFIAVAQRTSARSDRPTSFQKSLLYLGNFLVPGGLPTCSFTSTTMTSTTTSSSTQTISMTTTVSQLHCRLSPCFNVFSPQHGLCWSRYVSFGHILTLPHFWSLAHAARPLIWHKNHDKPIWSDYSPRWTVGLTRLKLQRHHSLESRHANVHPEFTHIGNKSLKVRYKSIV